jgi:hypothetical protein
VIRPVGQGLPVYTRIVSITAICLTTGPETAPVVLITSVKARFAGIPIIINVTKEVKYDQKKISEKKRFYFN